HQSLGQGAFGEGGMARQHVIKSAAQTVNVGPGVYRVAVERLLGSEVVGGSQHFFIVGDRQRFLVFIIEKSRQSHIENFEKTVGIDEQVAWLDVPVHHSCSVRMNEPF